MPSYISRNDPPGNSSVAALEVTGSRLERNPCQHVKQIENTRSPRRGAFRIQFRTMKVHGERYLPWVRRSLVTAVIFATAFLVAQPDLAQSEGGMPAPDHHPVPSIQDTETPAQRDARMQWWRDARFGMFIHWGLYSIPAGTWNGERI